MTRGFGEDSPEGINQRLMLDARSGVSGVTFVGYQNQFLRFEAECAGGCLRRLSKPWDLADFNRHCVC